jgi:hypothetical protein
VPQRAAEEINMKTNIAISALFTAAAFLTPAHATPILFSATTTLPAAGNYSSPVTLNLNDNAGYILAYGYDDMFSKNPSGGSTAVAPQNGATPVGLTVQKDLSNTEGLGDHNTNVGQDNGFIAPTDAVVLDFANVNKTATNASGTGSENQITFNMYQDYAGADYEVYALTGGTVNTSNATWTLIKSGVIVAGQNLSVQTSATQYTYYAIGVTDCAIDIQNVAVQYSGTTTQQTPEPGTFVMGGMALIGLGLTMKKRNRKA